MIDGRVQIPNACVTASTSVLVSSSCGLMVGQSLVLRSSEQGHRYLGTPLPPLTSIASTGVSDYVPVLGFLAG